SFVLVSEFAPERVIWIETTNCLEGKCLQAPWLERMMIVGGAFSVDLHAVAKLTGVLMKRGLKPALAQATTFEPLRCEGFHFLHDRPRVDIGRTEQFKRSRGAAPFRERSPFEHDRSRVGARHPQIRRVRTRVYPGPCAKWPAESRRCVGPPILHLN